MAICGRVTVTRNLMGTMIGWYCLNGGGKKVLAAVRIDDAARHAPQRSDEFRHRRFGGRQPAPPLARRYVRDTQVFRTVRCHRQEAGGRRTVASRIFDRLVNTHANLDTATVASWWRRRRSSPPRLPPRRWLPRARRGSPRLRHAPSMGETGAFLVESVHRGSSDSVGRHVANWIAACDYLRR